MIDWQAFKRGEFAVRCDTENKAERFLQECRERGIRWRLGTEIIPNYESSMFDGPKYFEIHERTGGLFYADEYVHSDKCVDYPDHIVDANKMVSAQAAKDWDGNLVPNQSLKSDAGKPQLTLVPTGVIRAMAAVRAYGIQARGGNDSWRSVGAVRLRDAAYRHWLAYLDEPDGVDADSGLPHIWHCVTNMAFLVEMGEKK